MSGLPFHTVIVHSMPRTSSNTIRNFVDGILVEMGVRVFHLHYGTRPRNLDWRGLSSAVPQDDIGTGIISCCREPIAQNLSYYWKFIAPRKPAWQSHADTFYAMESHWDQARWWETELQDWWNIDPFSAGPFTPPFSIVRNKLLLLRTENIEALPEAVGAWLGLDLAGRPVPHANHDGHAPPDRPAIPITASYLHAMYFPNQPFRFPSFFYSDEELLSLQYRWLHPPEVV